MVLWCPHRDSCLHRSNWSRRHIFAVAVATTKVESEGHGGILPVLAGYPSTPPHPHRKKESHPVLSLSVPAKPHVCRVTEKHQPQPWGFDIMSKLHQTTAPRQTNPENSVASCHRYKAPYFIADDKPCLGTSVGEFPLLFLVPLESRGECS